MGSEAISNIIKERLSKGEFKDINDFIERIDPKDVNKLQLEGLVKSGAFDVLEENRNKLFSSIPKIISNIKQKYEDKVNNQSSLFANTDTTINSFEFENIQNWSKKEKLLEEFKSLGFFISDHPLTDYEDFFKELNIVSYKDFLINKKNESQVAGTLMSIQEKKTQKGTPYAIGKFSDKLGEFELFIFSENLIRNREKLKESESFILNLQKENDKNDGSLTR